MFIVERTGKRPSLPQSPADPLGPVEVLGVAQIQRPEYRCERIGSFRHANEMDVVRHEAISQDLQPVLGVGSCISDAYMVYALYGSSDNLVAR